MPLRVTPGHPKVAFLCITPVRLVYEVNCCLYVIEVSTVFQWIVLLQCITPVPFVAAKEIILILNSIAC